MEEIAANTFVSNSHDLRKSIARVLTVTNATQRNQLRLFYKKSKYLPLDLRPKQTRAIRRRLSPEDKARVLEKTKKRNTHFPQRKFAIKVRLKDMKFQREKGKGSNLANSPLTGLNVLIVLGLQRDVRVEWGIEAQHAVST